MRTPILDSTAPVAPYVAGENPYLLRSESSEAGRSILDIATPASDSYIKVLNTGVAVLQTPAQLATTLGIDLIGTFSTIRLSGVANPSLAFYLSGNTAVSLPTSGTLATVAQLGDLQPLDVELTALAGLTSAADKLPYFTGSGTASLAAFTAAGRTLVGLATSSALVTLAGTSPSIVGTNLLQVGAPLSTPSYMKVRHNLDNEVTYLTPAEVLAELLSLNATLDAISELDVTGLGLSLLELGNPPGPRYAKFDHTGLVGTISYVTATEVLADIGGGPGYLVYAANLTQVGTSAPTAAVLANTLGGTIVWSYSSPGTYIGTLAGAFPNGKVPTLTRLVAIGDTSVLQIERGNDNTVLLHTWNAPADTSTNNILDATFIEIRVYP